MERQLPSHFEIVPNIAALDRLIHDSTPIDQRQSARRGTEQLIYHLRGACWSFERLEEARLAAIDFFNKGEPAVNRGLILTDDLRDRIWLAFDAYLINMRCVFDSLVPYLSRCQNIPNMPSSLHDLVNKIKRNKTFKLDEAINTLLCRFWDEVGEKVTAYRDRSMHTAIVSGDCLVYFMPPGFVALEVLLPDNPHEPSPKKMNYDPGVKLMYFVETSVYKTIQYVNAIIERLIDIMAPDDADARKTSLMQFLPRKAFEFGPGVERQGEPVPFSVDIHTIVKRAANDPIVM
jgi:hypothetical protein